MDYLKTLICPQCNKQFQFIEKQITQSQPPSRRRYCTYKCKRRFNYQPDTDKSRQRYLNSAKGKVVRKRKEFKRRSAKKNAIVEFVDLQMIAQRDKYKCHICRKRVNMNLEYNNRYSATLDHLIPVSLGGDHTNANVRLAHRACNSRKGNRSVNDQLMLFG